MGLISIALPVQKSFGENLLLLKKGITNFVLRSVIFHGKLERKRLLKISGIGKVLTTRIGVVVLDPSMLLYEQAKNISSGVSRFLREITIPVKNVENETVLGSELSYTPIIKNHLLSFQNYVLRLIMVKHSAINVIIRNRKVLIYG